MSDKPKLMRFPFSKVCCSYCSIPHCPTGLYKLYTSPEGLALLVLPICEGCLRLANTKQLLADDRMTMQFEVPQAVLEEWQKEARPTDG